MSVAPPNDGVVQIPIPIDDGYQLLVIVPRNVLPLSAESASTINRVIDAYTEEDSAS
jgi:hypothetical protein